MTIGRRVAFTCQQCWTIVLTTAHLDDPELAQLREHVRNSHPDEELGPDASIAETLSHYRAEVA